MFKMCQGGLDSLYCFESCLFLPHSVQTDIIAIGIAVNRPLQAKHKQNKRCHCCAGISFAPASLNAWFDIYMGYEKGYCGCVTANISFLTPKTAGHAAVIGCSL